MNIKDLIEYLVNENVTVHISISANNGDGGGITIDSGGDIAVEDELSRNTNLKGVDAEDEGEVFEENLASSEEDTDEDTEDEDNASPFDDEASAEDTEEAVEEEPEFDEVFGVSEHVFGEEEEEPEDDDADEEEPTNEDRDEAAADFEELFG